MTGTLPVPKRALALVALLGAAMVTATYLQGALSVLSRFVIDELGISRSQLGLVFSAFSLTGAAASPLLGSLTDRGTRKVMFGLFALGTAAVLVAAGAPTFWILLVGSVLGGLALAAGNPVTNRIISERISPRRRGIVTGLKQSGPPMGLLVAGVLLPPLAALYGWRAALALTALLPVAGLVATWWLVPERTAEEGVSMPESTPDARTAVVWLTGIGLGVAFGAAALIAFLPLYAQEQVGMTTTQAGTLAAVMGLVGVVGRIMWGSLGGRFARPTTGLIVITGVAVLASLAVAGARTFGPGILWVGAIGAGATALAWHALAWLVVIDRVGTAGVGRASGIIQVGNSIGFAAGPPAAGVIVDLTGSYLPAWLMVAAVFGVITVLTVMLRMRT